MKKNVVISVIVLTLILGVIGGIIFAASSQLSSKEKVLPIAITPPAPDSPSTTLSSYVDSAGYTFQYPDDFTVNNKSSEDVAVYSDVVVSSKTNENGSILIKVEDTKLKALDAWLKAEGISSVSAQVSSSSLGGLSANIVKTDDKTQIVAIDKGILFVVTLLANKNKDYFLSAYDTIVSSFAFVKPEEESSTDSSPVGSSGGDDVVVEEETIE